MLLQRRWAIATLASAVLLATWLLPLRSGLAASDAPNPVASASLSDLNASPVGSPGLTATLAFVSDSRVAVLACDGIGGALACRLALIDYRQESLRPVSGLELQPGSRKSLLPVRGGCLLLREVWGNVTTLFSADLKSSVNLSMNVVPSPSFGSVIGDYKSGTWALYKIDALRTELIREGHGELQSVSDSVALFREGDVIHVESLDGRKSSAMAVSKCGGIRAEPAGPEHLFIEGCGDGGTIRGLNWGFIRSIAEPPGWGGRHGWTSDGGRILFDHYTRTVSASERSLEALAAAATLGLGSANEQANGERIQVIDTKTGGVCFDWDSKLKPLGLAGEYHADISPSGGLVAVVGWGKLMIYRMPNTCP